MAQSALVEAAHVFAVGLFVIGLFHPRAPLSLLIRPLPHMHIPTHVGCQWLRVGAVAFPRQAEPALPHVIAAMEKFHWHEGIQRCGIRVIVTLSNDPEDLGENQVTVMNMGGGGAVLDALGDALVRRDKHLAKHALKALVNLADDPLRSGDRQAQLCEMRAPQRVVAAMQLWSAHSDMREVGCRALSKLATVPVGVKTRVVRDALLSADALAAVSRSKRRRLPGGDQGAQLCGLAKHDVAATLVARFPGARLLTEAWVTLGLVGTLCSLKRGETAPWPTGARGKARLPAYLALIVLVQDLLSTFRPPSPHQPPGSGPLHYPLMVRPDFPGPFDAPQWHTGCDTSWPAWRCMGGD